MIPTNDHIDDLICVGCGNTPNRESKATHCEHCECDFLSRPPRSYREMEGIQTLIEEPLPAQQMWNSWREGILIERWLWFFFVCGLSLASLLMLF